MIKKNRVAPAPTSISNKADCCASSRLLSFDSLHYSLEKQELKRKSLQQYWVSFEY